MNIDLNNISQEAINNIDFDKIISKEIKRGIKEYLEYNYFCTKDCNDYYGCEWDHKVQPKLDQAINSFINNNINEIVNNILTNNLTRIINRLVKTDDFNDMLLKTIKPNITKYIKNNLK